VLHWRIDGALDAGRLEQAWNTLLQRHPVLRTSFESGARPLRQIVHRAVPLRWRNADWRDRDELQQERDLADLVADERRRGFDLADPPLWCCHLLRLRDDRFRFVWCFHHILLDGWSLPVLFRELFQLYATPMQPLPSRRPFKDYIAWLQQQDSRAAGEHWRRHLDGFSAPTPLPAAHPIAAEAADTDAHGEVLFAIEAAVSHRLVQLAAEQHVTVGMLLQAAWAVLLGRYSGESDVVFGVTVSGRNTGSNAPTGRPSDRCRGRGHRCPRRGGPQSMSQATGQSVELGVGQAGSFTNDGDPVRPFADLVV
jgi:hypothetical protein